MLIIVVQNMMSYLEMNLPLLYSVTPQPTLVVVAHTIWL